MPTTSVQRHTRHASSTQDATYPIISHCFATFKTRPIEKIAEIHFLARSKVEEFACACNSDALVQPMALLETLGDLPPQSVADFFIAVLLPARQNNNHNNNPPQLTKTTCVTLLLLFRTSAIKRPPTSVKPTLQGCIVHHVKSFPEPAHMQKAAYQADHPQALESAEACAQPRNVVIL
jgi:hypothetical protein